MGDIIQKILDVQNKLMDRNDAGEPSIHRFLELDGFQTITRLLDIKDMDINIAILPFLALMINKGPDTVVPTMVEKDIPKKLALFWEDTPPFIIALQESYKNIKEFKKRCVNRGETKNSKEIAVLDNYKLLIGLCEAGFYVFDALA